MPGSKSLLFYIKRLKRPVFTTRDLVMVSGKTASAVSQGLKYLEREEVVFKIHHGVWAESNGGRLSPYDVIPFLFPRHRAYVSFTSALHLYGIIEQIPQVVTLASTSHTRKINTQVGTFSVHRLAPRFFKGFAWYKERGRFLVAEPEKALVDSLYLSARKKKQFGHFPELHFSKGFSLRKARRWVRAIPDSKIRTCVEGKFLALVKSLQLEEME